MLCLTPSVQAQVTDLLRALRVKHRIDYLFNGHDVRVARSAAAHEVMAMKQGKVAEAGPAHAIVCAPRGCCTRALMTAASEREPIETGATAE